jgi:hypothetical protein
MHRTRPSVATILLLLALLLPPLASAAPLADAYTLTDLGEVLVAGVDPLQPLVAGTLLGPTQVAALLFPVPVPLGFLPGGTFSIAAAICNGETVGLCGTGPFSLFTHACTFTGPGGLIDEGTLGDPDLFSAATSCNLSLIVAGYAEVPDRSHLEPTLWEEGVPRTLRLLADQQSAFLNAINDAGYSAGVATDEAGVIHAAFWSFAGAIFDLGANSEARGINNRGGEIVVQDRTPVSQAGVYRSDGKHVLVPLEGLEMSEGDGLDDDGNVLGASVTEGETPGGTIRVATLWDAADQPIALQPRVTNAAGWQLQRVLSRNTQGLIAGEGLFQGVRHGFVLTPAGDPPPALVATVPSAPAPPSTPQGHEHTMRAVEAQLGMHRLLHPAISTVVAERMHRAFHRE